jgi:hypothetical protein
MVDLGRFSLNNRDQISFSYVLADGRSGVAIASLQRRKDRWESETVSIE